MLKLELVKGFKYFSLSAVFVVVTKAGDSIAEVLFCFNSFHAMFSSYFI